MNSASDQQLFRPTFATVDLDALAHNFAVIEKRIAGRAGIMAMVKADAYGHGAVQVSRTLARCGVRSLGVATVEEGIELRNAGIESQILVMGGLLGAGSAASHAMVDCNLTPVIHSAGVLESLEADAALLNRRVAIHVKIDTGMSRLGLRPESLGSFISQIKKCPHLFVEGVLTHLAEVDREEMNSEQMQRFADARRLIESGLGEVRVWHIASSGAILRGAPVEITGAKECWVRPGIALYGDIDELSLGGELRPVMGLESRAVLIKRIPEGARVSYGGTFTTRRLTRIACVPIGYADGYPWNLSGRAHVLVRGRRCPVLGRVTMDMIVVDVTDVPGASVNDQVVLLGEQQGARIELRELAAWAGTITYEILCGISKRMPRVYL